MSPVLFGFLVIYSPKYSTYDTITEAHVRIHAIEELQPSNHQKLHQYGSCSCPAYWQEPPPVGLGSGEGIHVALVGSPVVRHTAGANAGILAHLQTRRVSVSLITKSVPPIPA